MPCGGTSGLLPLLRRFNLHCHRVGQGLMIPGSYWGAPEAGLVGNRLYIRNDTPLHSALHEGCHYICMDQPRRANLHTDAGGDDAEENAVCYLQITLADLLPGVDRLRLCKEMDAWGYSFRFGSAQAWYEQDADDALAWLIEHDILQSDGKPTWSLRQ
ncbi:MAG TPA: hypothetical protein DDY14_04065 [Chromatiaceae bacterium]|nr:MAG: hypothetical protein N838_11155 [Thiohalocapsa sp. PB-PSB1]HBG94502.1 hypothetical protein [Chromatiaceae bacterium]HCS88880.1 hypothetical protein [Chromatiaceae bacterium]